MQMSSLTIQTQPHCILIHPKPDLAEELALFSGGSAVGLGNIFARPDCWVVVLHGFNRKNKPAKSIATWPVDYVPTTALFLLFGQTLWQCFDDEEHHQHHRDEIDHAAEHGTDLDEVRHLFAIHHRFAEWNHERVI